MGSRRTAHKFLEDMIRWRYKNNPDKAEVEIAAARARYNQASIESQDDSLGPDSGMEMADHAREIRKRADSLMDILASFFDQSSSRAFGISPAIDDELEGEFRRILSDPDALDGLSQANLDHIRLASQTEIERLESAIKQNEAVIQDAQANPGWTKSMEERASKRANAELGEHILKHRLMVRLVEAVEARRSSSEVITSQPTEEEKREKEFAARQSRIDRMRRDRDADVEHLRSQGASDEEIARRENMWNDGIAREEVELSEWLA